MAWDDLRWEPFYFHTECMADQCSASLLLQFYLLGLDELCGFWHPLVQGITGALAVALGTATQSHF